VITKLNIENNDRVTISYTPNPNSIKFIFDSIDYLPSKEFFDISKDSPKFINDIFSLGNISYIFISKNFVSIKKSDQIEWDEITDKILNVLQNSNISDQIFNQEENSGVSTSIEKIVEEKIRPMLQNDGGDIQLIRFDSKLGVLYVRLVGSCVGCPYSRITLKSGIENLLKSYFPEIISVECVN
jgi:Fe-S cluster biogenesis protein NfuA